MEDGMGPSGGREEGTGLRPGAPRLAALYVLPDGPYASIPGLDPWDASRDARRYAGPHPVVAHPPCERWGRYWFGGPSARVRRVKGDDNGCFAAALASVRRYGGILEHPAASHAWAHFGINRPPRAGGWVKADDFGGWTCCVDQKHYGHRAQKATWLYAVGCELPDLIWGKSTGGVRLDEGFHSAEERRRAIRTGICQRLSRRQRMETPPAFRDLLISIALTAYPAALEDVRICTGCGWDSRKPLKPGAIACCPNSRYRTLAKLLREALDGHPASFRGAVAKVWAILEARSAPPSSEGSPSSPSPETSK